jgi:DNA-directed RNA polymerase specialized sigma24 family protein
LRRGGSSPADAADLVQGFFALLLEREDLAAVHPERGRFRSFLLASLKHFQANKRDREAALKRGGGRAPLSLDVQAAEDQLKIELADQRTPETIFDRCWALTVLERTKTQLRDLYDRAGKLQRYEVLWPHLGGEALDSYQHAAEALAMTEGAVKTAAHRMRREYRDLIRAEIAQTVASEEEIEAEIGALFEALRR